MRSLLGDPLTEIAGLGRYAFGFVPAVSCAGVLLWASQGWSPWVLTFAIASLFSVVRPDGKGTERSASDTGVDAQARALEFGGVGVWERNLATNEVWTSPVLAGMFGGAGPKSFEEVLSAVHPDDRQRLLDSFNACAFGEMRYEVEFRTVLADGTIRWLCARGGAERDGDGIARALRGTFEDVTSRKRDREDLEARDTLYEGLAENVPGIVYQMLRFPDGSRTVPYISKRVEDVFGVTREQVYKDANLLIEAIHPADREEKEDAAGQAMDSLTQFDWTGRIVRPDGGVRWIHALCLPTRRPDGAYHWDGVMLDVTDVKEAELDHIETKNRLTWLLRSSPVVIYSCAGESPYPITYLSDNAEELLGIPVEPSLLDALYWQKRIHPDDSEMALRAMEDVFHLGSNSIEYRMRVASGEYRWIREDMRHIADGDKSAVVGIVVDVTERRLAQDALRLSDERFLAMSNASPLGVLLTDPAGGVLYVNAKLSEITGVPAEELFGGRFLALVHNEDSDRVRDAVASSIAKRREISIQCRLQKPDHTMIWCSIKTAPMLDGNRLVGFVGTVEDVTERFDLEMQSEQSRIKAERANQAKSAFLSRISHELRTPLHAMLGFAQLLQMGDLEDSQKESVENILGSGHHLLSLIRDLLDIARAESGELGVQVTSVSLYPVVEEALQMLSALANEKGIAIETRFDEADSVSVIADRQRLRQSVINVLSNAIKYNLREGTVAISCEVRPDGFVVLTVRDTGTGIPPENADRLFTPFDRLGAESSDVEGTGLGLTLTKRLIEAMGGTLELESDEKRGTTVDITLRYAGSRQAGSAVVQMPSGPRSLARDKRAILLIEDNESNIRFMESVLSSRPHYALETVRSGKAGVEAAMKCRPDLVLLDMNLPDMNGATVLERIRSEPTLASTSVVVISATANVRQVERTKKLGASAYLTKPLDLNELLRAIDDALGATKP